MKNAGAARIFLYFNKLVFPRAEAERRSRLYRVDTVPRLDALDEMRLPRIVLRGVDKVDARLIYRHGIK